MRSWFVAAAWVLLLLSAGCHHGARYKASSLPAEFMAPRWGSLQNVDLSRIARSAGNANVLYPGDLVEITIATGLEENTPPRWSGRISDEGTVDVPLIGRVQIAGLDVMRAGQVIRDESIRRGKFVDPNVTLRRVERRSNHVTVVGAVDKPGIYELPVAGSDVLSAIVKAGGLTENASTIIEVRHPPFSGNSALAGHRAMGDLVGYSAFPEISAGAREMRIDLEQIKDPASVDLHVEDGSTVMIMPRPKRFVHVIGLVNSASQFEMPEDQELRLLDALALAGGRTLSVADKVHIIRTIPGRADPVLIKASVREAKSKGAANIRLAAGDVVSVEETPVTFLIGTVREFVRFGFSSSLPLF